VKTAILGAGAMGSLLGGQLALGGKDVVLLGVDQEHLDAVNRDGLTLEFDSGTQHVRIKAMQPTELKQPVDLIVVLTKTYQTEAALRDAQGAIGPDTQVLTIQNGLGNAERVATAVPLERVYIGMNLYNGAKQGPGRISTHGEGKIVLWSADGKDRPAAHRIAGEFSSAGITCSADPNVQKAIWEKVCFNTGMNPVAALTRSTVGGMADHGGELVLSVVSESCAVARAAGFDVNEESVSNTVQMAFAKHRGHKSSMFQDLAAGRRTEIDAINGAIAAHAQRLGVPAPLNTLLTRLIRLAEASAAQA
jgi:2-dehydropantoate 2-reductase